MSSAATMTKPVKRKMEFEDDCGFVFRRKKANTAVPPAPVGAPAVELKPVTKSVAKPTSKAANVTKKAEKVTAPAKKAVEGKKAAVAATPVKAPPPIPAVADLLKVTPSKRQVLERQRRRSSLSSLAVAGARRRSSLGVGFTHDMPPASVEASQYHRHILPDLPGPLKLKQLLVWAVQKAAEEMGQKGKESDWEECVAEPLVQGLHTNGICTSWYQRPTPATSKAIQQPNPVNIDMRECLALYQRYNRQLHAELAAWKHNEDTGSTSLALTTLLPPIRELRPVLPTPDLGAMCKWLHRLPFHVDRLGWLLQVYAGLEVRSRAYCEHVFRHIFERFFATASPSATCVNRPIAVLKALSSVQDTVQEKE